MGGSSNVDVAPHDHRTLGIFQISILIGSGIVAASQIGKSIISIPLIRAEMGFGYALAGLIMATFATLGASIGIGAGALISRVGPRRALVWGMAILSIANLAGAFASNGIFLLAARFVEGTGYFSVVLSVPTILARTVGVKRRDVVMALWSAYMPAGIMLFLLLGSVVSHIGWRQLWLADMAATALCAGLLAIVVPRMERDAARTETPPIGGLVMLDIVQVISDRRCLMLAAAFFAYSCQIFSLSFALPLLLISTHDQSIGGVGYITAGVLFVSAIGHLSAGFFLRYGIPSWKLLVAAFCAFAVSTVSIYGLPMSALQIACSAAVALGIGGLAPGALYAAAPQVAPSATTIPTTIGLLQQASSLGQFIGPLALGLCVDDWGWHAAPLVVTPIGIIGIVIGLQLRRRAADRPIRLQPSS
jgi:DHA1 family inner membrane transport protein